MYVIIMNHEISIHSDMYTGAWPAIQAREHMVEGHCYMSTGGE